MEILSHRFFSGPNRHTLASALEVILDLKAWGNHSTAEQPWFGQRLTEALPGIERHYCSLGKPGGFCERLYQGTYLGHVTEHVCLELLYLAGERGSYGKTREQGSPYRVMVVVETGTEAGGIAALTHAISIVTTLWDQGEVCVAEHVGETRRQVAAAQLGPSTAAIVRAARERGIPAERLDGKSYVRLGQGVAQHRILGTMSDRTSVLAADICQDKTWTKTVLRSAGIPVPDGVTATSELAAISYAERIGYPVVVKPLGGHHGDGVSMHLMTEAEVAHAFHAAALHGHGEVLVEQEVLGIAYRILVIDGDVVAAALRQPPFVVGDGIRTVEELVKELNQDPRRGPDHDFPMSYVLIDAVALLTLAQQGYHPQRVVPKGTRVWIRQTANMSTGANASDVTSQVGQALRLDAARAAQAVGLDIAGIDVVTPNLEQSLAQAGGAVIEINAAPGLRMHLYPSQGASQPVAEKIISSLFRESSGRIPLAAITGTNGKTTVTRMLAHIWSDSGKRVGMATTGGILIDSQLIQQGDLTGPWSARMVLSDPTVEVAILETARGGMARGGLGFDACDVAVVTNIGRDHLGQDGIDTLQDLVHLKALIVDVVGHTGAVVLNADDPLVLSMAERSKGRVVLFSGQEAGTAISQHVAQGGDAVYVKRGNLVCLTAGKQTRLLGIRVLPATLGGVASMNIANAAAAAAAALAMGLSPRQVSHGLMTFPAGGEGVNRGRLELSSAADIRILLDYGHNAPAIAALGDFIHKLKAKDVVCVLGLPGDRRDQDLKSAVRAAAQFCRQFIIREDRDLRGRQPNEVAALIYDELLALGLSASQIQVVLDEGQAVRQAILEAPAKSLVVVLYERYNVVKEAVAAGIALRQELISGLRDRA